MTHLHAEKKQTNNSMTFNHGYISIKVIAILAFSHFPKLVNCHCQFGPFFFLPQCALFRIGKIKISHCKLSLK